MVARWLGQVRTSPFGVNVSPYIQNDCREWAIDHSFKCGDGYGRLLMQITEDPDSKVGKEAVNVLENCKYNIRFRPR